MSDKQDNGHIDLKRMLLRKDRPLPKAGCSWAFYAALLLIVAYLVIMFIKYRNA